MFSYRCDAGGVYGREDAAGGEDGLVVVDGAVGLHAIEFYAARTVYVGAVLQVDCYVVDAAFVVAEEEQVAPLQAVGLREIYLLACCGLL